MPTAVAALLLAMGSPWWEDYAIKETYLCSERGQVVVERNDAQASLITGRYRTTLFRQQPGSADAEPILGIVYRNDLLTLILRGDQMILEQLPQRTSCMRTESV
ncbi:MAG: hypothetical protein FJ050_01670 [Cyanobacteria bacterium M_surface_7_m2_040]|nr:hypothetical protein [Cyanobacteria bacterium M_surface_7_m2_040]